MGIDISEAECKTFRGRRGNHTLSGYNNRVNLTSSVDKKKTSGKLNQKNIKGDIYECPKDSILNITEKGFPSQLDSTNKFAKTLSKSNKPESKESKLFSTIKNPRIKIVTKQLQNKTQKISLKNNFKKSLFDRIHSPLKVI